MGWQMDLFLFFGAGAVGALVGVFIGLLFGFGEGWKRGMSYRTGLQAEKDEIIKRLYNEKAFLASTIRDAVVDMQDAMNAGCLKED